MIINVRLRRHRRSSVAAVAVAVTVAWLALWMDVVARLFGLLRAAQNRAHQDYENANKNFSRNDMGMLIALLLAELRIL